MSNIFIKFNQSIKAQWNLLLIALVFFTRIPVAKFTDFNQQRLNQSSRYFSLVGWIVGGVSSAVFLVMNIYFSDNIALLFSMLISVFLTGCFHEDGLADTCDGFGGGWKKQDKLNIMKDSRLGTYGAVSLWFILTLKYFLLLETNAIVIALLIAHPLSRSISSAMIYFLPYVMDEEKSKIKPLAESHRTSDFLINMLFGLMGLILLTHAIHSLILLFALLIAFFILRKIFISQIGGFTGDTLGATQQISEIVIYMMLVVFLGSTGSLFGSSI